MAEFEKVSKLMYEMIVPPQDAAGKIPTVSMQ